MRNILMTLAFDGTSYAGWQRQNVQPTIQGAVEEKLSIMVGEKVVIHGAGRTDAGVHALGMTASFHTDSSIPCRGFLRGLNSMLRKDIRILKVVEKEFDFHARKSAVGKEYQYFVKSGEICLPTERLYCCHINWAPDMNAMGEALSLLTGEHDFSSFEASGSRDLSCGNGRGAVRRLSDLQLLQSESDPGSFSFVISGDGFLRHMVRNIAGAVLAVGRGKITVAGFKKILAAQDRKEAPATAPPQGLFLNRVDY